ncbi:MAG: CsbD family protein [Deltaproteobacteria bacterium]
MATSGEDKFSGKLDETAGKAKRIVGEVTDNPQTKLEGEAQKIKGKFEQVKGNVKESLHDKLDET